MIPHLGVLSHNSSRSAEWPNISTGGGCPLFRGRQPLRQITVMIDAELLEYPLQSQITRPQLLAGMLAHPLVRCFRYADDGPPASLPRIAVPHFDISYVDGWVELLPGDESGFVVRNIQYGNGGLGQTAIVGNALDMVRRDIAATSYAELGHDATYKRRYNDALAAQAADAMNVDLYVTERAYLHENTFRYSGGAACCNVQDAIAILSLYLRTQGEFELFRFSDGKGAYRMNEGLFYWVGTRELLPEAWRWFSACVHESAAAGNDALMLLSGSALSRVQRALRARDDALRELCLPQNNDTAEHALSALDIVWLNLMGAVDVTSRVAHLALQLSIRITNAGWQKPGWMSHVRAAAPSVAAVMADPSEHFHTLTILSNLRNSIHGEALQAVGIGLGRSRTGTLIGIPQDDGPKLLESIEALGDRNSWGIKELVSGRYHVEPATLLDQLFPRVIRLLNAVMLVTPVERFQNARLTPENTVPPSDANGPFAERNRLSVRWQLGF
jgi:hypothetical protein